jgi:ferric iron reductase protein FhuF
VLPERYQGPLPLAEIGRPVATAEELRRFVLDGLFGRTFLPLVDMIHAMTGVSPQVLWGQVAYEADLFMQQLARVAPEERTAAWEEDRAAFFERREWSVAPGPSPLQGPTRVLTILDPNGGEPTTRTLRSTCCLIYQVPTGKMCGACPLAPKKERVAEKRATVEERRAVHREAASVAR